MSSSYLCSKLCWLKLCLTPFPFVFPPLFSFIPPSPHHSPTQPLVTRPPPLSPSVVRRSSVHCTPPVTSLFSPSPLLWNVKTLVLLSWLNQMSFLSQISPLFYFALHLQSFLKVAALFASPLPQPPPVPPLMKIKLLSKTYGVAEQLMRSTFF